VADRLPNACSIGRSPTRASLVVTTGLLELLDLIELEGVLAHELVHIQRGETIMAGVAVITLGPLARLTGNDRWLHRARGMGCEYRADQLATAAVRYPPGLREALATLSVDRPVAPDSLFASSRLVSTRWLWVDPMVGRRSPEFEIGNLDATAVRAAALAQT
jgi:Peptidase family M48